MWRKEGFASSSHEVISPDVESQRITLRRVWEQHASEVEKITDRVGTGIDKGIQEAVTAMRVFGFPTTQSCEGHVSENGASFPWIEIYTTPLDGWKEDEEKRRKWILENLKEQRKMLDLLNEFYQTRETPFELRLSLDSIGALGGFRIHSLGAQTMPLYAPQDQKNMRELYKNEMDAFVIFLREKYFAG